MSLLLGLIPSSASRWLLALLALAALCGYVFHRGVEFEHNKMQLAIDAIQHAGDQQSLANAQKTIQHKEEVTHVVEDFHSNIAAINDYWVRQHRADSRAGGVSKVPAAPAGVAGTCSDPRSSGPYQELEQACAVTTEMFNACRDGWLSQEK
jgi:hypothetical protein